MYDKSTTIAELQERLVYLKSIKYKAECTICMDKIVGSPVLGTCGHFFHAECLKGRIAAVQKVIDELKQQLGDIDEYDDRWADVLCTHERALAQEAVEMLQELSSTEREIIACPACPRCKVPGAFFKMYTR